MAYSNRSLKFTIGHIEINKVERSLCGSQTKEQRNTQISSPGHHAVTVSEFRDSSYQFIRVSALQDLAC